MNKIVHIDFETRSRVDIFKAGAGRYCYDPSTRILCTAWAVDDGPVRGDYSGFMPDAFVDLIKQGYVFCAHNALFEYMVWDRFWGKPPRFIDTMAQAGMCGLPASLEKCAKALHLKFKKDMNGKFLINKLCKPRKDGTFFAGEPQDRRDFLDYCKTDVKVEREIYHILPKLNDKEQELYHLTEKINVRGLCIDTELAEKAMIIADALKIKYNARLVELSNKTLYSLGQVQRIKKFLNNRGLELESLNKDSITEALLTCDDPLAREVMDLRLKYSKSSVSKYDKALAGTSDDGRFRSYLIYHGASTGRWTSKSLQLHNLPRSRGTVDTNTAIKIIKKNTVEEFDFLYENPMVALTECIRGMIVAEKGKTLLVADYSAIEARVLMWLAKEQKGLSAFREGRDIYVEMAKVVDYKTPDRQLGKQIILGSGFGMGANKFHITCQGYGLNVDPDLAEKCIKSYRGTYKKVPAFWRHAEQAVRNVLQTGKGFILDDMKFNRDKMFLRIFLPSGRPLYYFMPGIDEDNNIFYYTLDSQTQNFKKTYTYGGKLVENIVQATARDLMAWAMLDLERLGYPVVLSVHDEIICEVPEMFGQRKDLEIMIEIMCNLPDWAAGCPINAKGFVTERYRK